MGRFVLLAVALVTAVATPLIRHEEDIRDGTFVPYEAERNAGQATHFAREVATMRTSPVQTMQTSRYNSAHSDRNSQNTSMNSEERELKLTGKKRQRQAIHEQEFHTAGLSDTVKESTLSRKNPAMWKSKRQNSPETENKVVFSPDKVREHQRPESLAHQVREIFEQGFIEETFDYFETDMESTSPTGTITLDWSPRLTEVPDLWCSSAQQDLDTLNFRDSDGSSLKEDIWETKCLPGMKAHRATMSCRSSIRTFLREAFSISVTLAKKGATNEEAFKM